MKTHPALDAWLDRIICGDALEVLPQLPAESVDLVLTDPPYFLDKLDERWTPERVARRAYKSQTVFHLPPGMKFAPDQGRRMYEWYLRVSQQVYRILKPGASSFPLAAHGCTIAWFALWKMPAFTCEIRFCGFTHRASPRP